MASTIKVNNIQNQCGANIVNKCSTTITLGASGDNITLACGATQSGFGRTGTVNWDTTAKTGNFTAVSGTGYFVNTTSAAITMNLPASPSAGDIVSIKDYAYTFGTNNFIVDGNGSPIGGTAGTIPVTYSTNGTSKTFVYVDGTKGWLVTNESTDTSQESNAQYIVATGGTVTCCGDYKIHTFTGPGTFTVTCGGNPAGSDTVDYLVVAGGGGGGNGCGGGGAGAGGFRESKAACAPWTASPLATCVSLPVTATSYPITVGGGGATSPSNTGSSGANSVFSTITSAGGGGGGKENTTPRDGVSGGSGGGGGGAAVPATGGSGNTPPTSPPQGNSGGNGSGTTPYVGGTGGGGGGASAAGTAGSNTGGTVPAPSSVGGDGHGTAINNIACVGTPGPTPAIRYFAGGGAGAVSQNHPGTPQPATLKGPAAGGGGSGGKGSYPSPGTANTGGGGGGGNGGAPGPAGTGGSGIVIIRYKYQ